jgi:hypothetical protein
LPIPPAGPGCHAKVGALANFGNLAGAVSIGNRPGNGVDNLHDMGLITVQIWDATGSKRQDVEMPDDAPINRVLAVLLEKMNFPRYAPDGQPLSYKLHHRASGKQLLDEQTLGDLAVKPGDVLRLQPEITAG